jgi:hypothetical protein
LPRLITEEFPSPLFQRERNIDTSAELCVDGTMSTVRNTEKASVNERHEGHLGYYLAIGLVAGAAVISSAVLPREMAGLGFTVAAVLIGLIDFLARRFSHSPLSTRPDRGTIVYLAAFVVVLIIAVALVWTVVRNGDAMWLAWTMAGLVFAVIVAGNWIVDRRSTRKAASAT